MLQQEHPESLVRSLVLSEIEMAYLRTEREGLGYFCMFCGVMEKLCGASTPACCKEGNKLDILLCPSCAPFLFGVQCSIPIEKTALVQEGRSYDLGLRSLGFN